MGIDPSTLSPAFKKCMVSHPPGQPPKYGLIASGPITKAIQSPLEKLNQTERRLYNLMVESGRFTEVIPHGFTFHIGYDSHYIPDLVCLGELKATIIECKGAFIFAKALNKLKACAIRYRCFNFELHEWKNNAWHITKYQ